MVQLAMELDLDQPEIVEPDGDSFLGILSHELVTSLAVVMGSLHAFKKHHPTMTAEVRERLLDNAIESGTELAMLLNSLLERIDEAVADGIQDHAQVPQ